MWKYALFFWIVIIGGCSTYPGDYDDKNMPMKETTIPLNYERVYKNLRFGLRRCALETNQIISSGKYVIDSEIFTDSKDAFFDISYLLEGPLSHATYYLGRIKLIGLKNNQTNFQSFVVKEKMKTPAENIHKNSLRWAQGELRC
jgi:hypothetical protein